MVCALAIAVIDLAFPAVSRWCMYTLLPESAWTTFWVVMVAVFVAYVLRSLFTYVVCFWGHNFGIRVETDIRRDLFRHMQKLSYGYFDQSRVGQLMSRMTTDLFDITEFAHHGPEDIFVSTVTIIGALIVMFTIQWRLAHCHNRDDTGVFARGVEVPALHAGRLPRCEKDRRVHKRGF